MSGCAVNDGPAANGAGSRPAARGGPAWGVLTLLCGALAVSSPWLWGLGAALSIGVALLLGGAAMLLFALRAPSFGGVVVRLLFAGLTVLVGLAVLGQPGLALAQLTALIGAYLIVDGVVSMIVAWNLKPAPGWGWVTSNGMVSIALGYLVLAGWPAPALWAVGLMVGIRLLLAGLTMLMVGASAGRA